MYDASDARFFFNIAYATAWSIMSDCWTASWPHAAVAAIQDAESRELCQDSARDNRHGGK